MRNFDTIQQVSLEDDSEEESVENDMAETVAHAGKQNSRNGPYVKQGDLELADMTAGTRPG